ncbi:hypothetical protein [Rhodococcus sp. MALMAid1271]|uniref:hypothetical protein n=1 Tax=Rhodococcus sp. MALMAid1271 TaxID=3411744 RepID=UPI003BA2DCA0
MTTTEPTAETGLTAVEIENGLALLRAPFEGSAISQLPKPTRKDAPKGNCPECGGYHGLPAIHLDYVGHAALTHRFLDVDIRWTWKPLARDEFGLPLFDKNGGLWISLTILGVTRLGYGDAPGKSGGNAVKEAIGDALRNAGMRFGAALDLWHKGDLHAAKAELQPPTAADILRGLIIETLDGKKIPRVSARDKFAADNDGENIETTTNELALQSLLDFFRALDMSAPDSSAAAEQPRAAEQEPAKPEPTATDKARVALREQLKFLGIPDQDAVEKFARDNDGASLKTTEDTGAVLRLLTHYRSKSK